MRVVFAECAPHYDNHLAPYQVWGFPEDGEALATAFEYGMLPANREMTRFYLARSVRIRLEEYSETGRVRYVKRKCVELCHSLLPRHRFEAGDEWIDLCLRYMNFSEAWASRRRDDMFGPASVWARLDMPMTTHLLTVTERHTERPVGLAIMYIEPPIAYYAMALFDENYRSMSIGNYMMASAITEAKHAGLSHMYLGTCYSEAALYKTRFAGSQYFDGIGWSSDRQKLHLMIHEQHKLHDRHLFEHGPYLAITEPPDEDSATMCLNGRGREHD